MSVIGSSVADNNYTYNIDEFYQSGLHYYLEKCQYQSKYCDELIIKTKKHINEKYQRYFDHFKSKDNLALIPTWWHIVCSNGLLIIQTQLVLIRSVKLR